MALQTENGWYQIGSSQCDKSVIPGTNIWVPLQAGRVSRIMKAFCADYHQHIEPLRQFDIGGWTPTNSVWNSNHLSATAMDLCWQLHPFGKRNTFTSAQLQVIHELVGTNGKGGFYEGWIYWAGFWKSVADEMHWQMGYSTYGKNADMDDFINRKIRSDGLSTFKRTPPPVNPVPRKLVAPGSVGTRWADVSQYQGKPVDASYPYEVFCFRTNSGDVVDKLVAENVRAAKALLDSGRVAVVIAYYFFRPGQENCDLHRKLLEANGLWGHSRLVTMVDVEGDHGTVAGDNSWEINDEVNRMRGPGWYDNYWRVIGYLNSNADPRLWPVRGGINLVVPQYSDPRSARMPGDISTISDAQVRKDAIAHQYTDAATDVAPWLGQGIDMNWSPYTVAELVDLLGLGKAETPSEPSEPEEPELPPDVRLPVLPGHISWEQLRATIGAQFGA